MFDAIRSQRSEKIEEEATSDQRQIHERGKDRLGHQYVLSQIGPREVLRAIRRGFTLSRRYSNVFAPIALRRFRPQMVRQNTRCPIRTTGWSSTMFASHFGSRHSSFQVDRSVSSGSEDYQSWLWQGKIIRNVSFHQCSTPIIAW